MLASQIPIVHCYHDYDYIMFVIATDWCLAKLSYVWSTLRNRHQTIKYIDIATDATTWYITWIGYSIIIPANIVGQNDNSEAEAEMSTLTSRSSL